MKRFDLPAALAACAAAGAALLLARIPVPAVGWALLAAGLYVLFSAASRAACTDPLTGLWNRVRWDRLMQRPARSGDALLMLDLDRLKEINDTDGHAAGDRVLTDFAGLLRSTLPAHGVLCRWGGDEFALLLPHTDRQTVTAYLTDLGQTAPPQIRFAAGFALQAEHPGLTRQQLLAEADRQLLAQKQRTRAHSGTA